MQKINSGEISNKTIEKRFKDLGIIAFDAVGQMDKEDIMMALDEVENFTKNFPDKEALKHIEKLQKEKKLKGF